MHQPSAMDDDSLFGINGVLSVLKVLGGQHADICTSRTSGTTPLTYTCSSSHIMDDLSNVTDVLSVLSVLSSLGIIGAIKIIDD